MKIGKDKMQHFGVCFAASAAASAVEAATGANYLQSFTAGMMAGAALGVGKEYGDKCAPGNWWDWVDLAADAAGSLAGSAVGSLFSLI